VAENQNPYPAHSIALESARTLIHSFKEFRCDESSAGCCSCKQSRHDDYRRQGTAGLGAFTKSEDSFTPVVLEPACAV